jgi:hypothetical protein
MVTEYKIMYRNCIERANDLGEALDKAKRAAALEGVDCVVLFYVTKQKYGPEIPHLTKINSIAGSDVHFEMVDLLY